MTNDEVRRNDEIRMTKPTTAQLRVFDIRASDFFRHSSFVIRHSTICTSQVILAGALDSRCDFPESIFGFQKCAVEPQGKAGYICSMKLLLAFAVWIGMGVVLGVGILMAVKGSPWLLIAGLIGFVIAVGKIGCMSH